MSQYLESLDLNSFPFEKVEVFRNSAQKPWIYSELDAYQRRVLEQVLEKTSATENTALGSLLVSELAPVITYGRRTPPEDLTGNEGFYAQAGVSRYAADRGGLATYHGPGQWVLFPVTTLRNLTGDPRGVRKAVSLLLEVALKVGLSYDPSAHIREGAELGVWTSRGKFAAVGIHVQKGVLLHGLCVNGFRTPTSFLGLRPCGLDAPVDFLLGNQPSETAFLDLGERLIRKFLQELRQTRIDAGSIQGYK